MNGHNAEEERQQAPAAAWGSIKNTAAFGAQYGGSMGGPPGQQGMPFGYDPSWLAQQGGNPNFGFASNQPFAQHHTNGTSGPGILTSRDNQTLNAFFGNADVTRDMAFDYDNGGMMANGDPQAHLTQARLMDIHSHPAAIDVPRYSADYNGVTFPSPMISNQRQHVNESEGDNHEHSEDEDDSTASAAANLVGMASDRHHSNGMNNLHGPFGVNNNGNMQFGQQAYQPPSYLNNYQPHHTHTTSWQEHNPIGFGNLHMGGFDQHDSPQNLAGPSSHFPQRPTYPHFGSDENFGRDGFTPPIKFEPDNRADNLTGVYGVQEASAPAVGSRHAPFAQPPFTQPFQPQEAPTYGYNPNGANFHNSQNYTYSPQPPRTGPQAMPDSIYGGLRMMNGRVVMPGQMPAQMPAHGHPHANPAQQRPPPNTMTPRQVQKVQSDGEDADQSEEDEPVQKRAPPSAPQSTRKRRQSVQDESSSGDEYQPTYGRKRRASSNAVRVPQASGGADRRGSSVSRARPNGLPTQRSNSASNSDNNSPAHARRQSDANGQQTVLRKSGSQISRMTLTEAQRRDNHIMSEKNRRDLIKTHYEELNDLVPALKGGKSGMSRAEVLKEIFEYIEDIREGNNDMVSHLKAKKREDRDGEGGSSGGMGGGVAAY